MSTGSGMSILSTLALRMVTQEGLETCLKLHRKCADSFSIRNPAVEKPETHISKSAKRRLRKKKTDGKYTRA